jgi:UDP-N-acetylmuramyl tripeptide synthase
MLVMLLAKLSRIAINIIDKSRGTDFPGKLALKLYKNFNSNFKKIDYGKVIIVTGSNGKSTMTNLLCRVLEQNGCKVGANLKGSNMINGATTVFINNVSLTGKPKADYFIIEADERSFPLIYAAFPAKNVLINNIMQDQVHRNGEPDYIYQIIKKTLNKDMTLFLNNDEPRSKSYEDFGGDVRYFCAQKLPTAFYKDGFADVTLPCPKCASKIEFDYLNLGNTGRFKCTGCGFSSEDLTAGAVTAAQDVDFDAGTFTLRGTAHTMPYSAPVMMYNYAGASAVCSHWGLSDETIARGMESFVNVAGRIETIPYGDKRIHYLRMKQENPETLQDALNAVAMDKGDKAS